MATHHVGRIARNKAIEQSLDAAIEIGEIIRGVERDAPALKGLVLTLLGSPSREVSTVKKDLFDDSRLTNLYYRAAAASGKEAVEELDRVIDLMLSAGAMDLTQMSQDDLAFIREFCLGLNQELVSEASSRAPEPPLSRSRQQLACTRFG